MQGKTPSSEQGQQKYVPVYSAQGQLAAEIIKLLLESVEIPVRLSQESAGIVYGLTVGPLGEVTILVPAEKQQEASAVLQAMEEGKLEEPFYYTDYVQSERYRDNKQDRRDQFTKESHQPQ
jgi:hypothetical protein